MSLKTALGQSRVLTFAVLAIAAWLLLTTLNVVESMESVWNPTTVGQTAAGGIAGVLVMAGILALLVFLYSEIGESSPAPQRWPPEE
ncbi:hypothetical protein [Halegenticoccus soli]|uniref:hypothetical protein n=1 Tax=Halegenticoccus soli TaxID=1985678 RepID=UPI000C6CA6E1|nr:hypothetical protein [Halegenticoccus soli]